MKNKHEIIKSIYKQVLKAPKIFWWVYYETEVMFQKRIYNRELICQNNTIILRVFCLKTRKNNCST